MTVALWIAFGILNGIVFYLIEPGNSNKNIIGAAGVGVLGSLAGGLVAYLMLGGRIMDLSTPLLLIFSLQAFALYYIFSAKKYKRI
jgi:uncharacterized membrane protein YeaQ/YmgE (transglycosylase-associated protein family)